MNDYGRLSSVTSMLNQLSWPTLQTRRKLSRLQTLHKMFYQQISLTIPPYYLPTSRSTRQYHPLHYILPHVSLACQTVCVGAVNNRLVTVAHIPGPLPECWQSQSDRFADSVTKQTLIIQILSVIKN